MIDKFITLTTTAVPLNIENVDTDQIIPARFLKATTKEGFGKQLFYDWRYDSAGNPKSGFVLNSPVYGGSILVAGKNFGCGNTQRGPSMEPDSKPWYPASLPIYSEITL